MSNFNVLLNNSKTVDSIISENITYCAEPHQLNEDDLIDNTNYYDIIDQIESELNIKFSNNERGKVFDYITDTISEWFNEDPTQFYI